jgi:capsular polysaccharide transport system permease protein
MLTGFIVLILILAVAVVGDVDIWPRNLEAACAAIFATLCLGLGLGTFNVVCTALFGPFYVIFYIVSMIGVYVSSGITMPSWLISESTRYYLSYNPLFNLVEWLRSAYYASYDPDLIDKSLVFKTAAIALLLGLLGERLLRNKFYT